MDEDAGSSDEDQQSSRCDISSICVEELSQTARHVTRQVQYNTAHAILTGHTLATKNESLTKYIAKS